MGSFSTRVITLMPVAIAINIVLGVVVQQYLKLPIYLDSIGTILVGVLAGPLAGAATGILSNLIWQYAPVIGGGTMTSGTSNLPDPAENVLVLDAWSLQALGGSCGTD